MLKSPLFWKMTPLFGAVLLLLIPIMLIRQVIVERADYRSDVEDAIRQSTSGPQKLVGPLIAIPVYRKRIKPWSGNEVLSIFGYLSH